MADDTFEYTAAQNVGLALMHSRQATEFLDKAVEQRAVVIPRAVVEDMKNAASEIAWGDQDHQAAKDSGNAIAETLDRFLA